MPQGSPGRSARGIDPEAMENNRQFVHQRDIDVALGIFDNLGRFGDLDRRGLMHSGTSPVGSIQLFIRSTFS